MKKKQAIFILVFLMASIFLMPSAPLKADLKTMEITIWYSFATEGVPQKLEELIGQFNESKHYGTLNKIPHRLKVVSKVFPTEKDLKKELLSGTTKPDIVIIDTQWIVPLARADKIVPLDNFMTPMSRAVHKTDTFKQIWHSTLFDDKTWLMPLFAFNRVLILNTDIISEEELKNPPKSWEELVLKCKKCIAKKKDVWGFAFPDDAEELAKLWLNSLRQEGGSYLTDDYTKTNFNSPEGKEILNFFVELAKKPKLTSPTQQDFFDNKVAFYMARPSEVFLAGKKGIKFITYPLPKIKIRSSYLTVRGFVILKSDAEREKAAWTFINWFSDFKNSLQWALNTPFIPPNKQVYLSGHYYQHRKDNPFLSTHITQMDYSYPFPSVDNSNELLYILGSYLKLALGGSLSTEETLIKSSQDLDCILAGKKTTDEVINNLNKLKESLAAKPTKTIEIKKTEIKKIEAIKIKKYEPTPTPTVSPTPEPTPSPTVSPSPEPTPTPIPKKVEVIKIKKYEHPTPTTSPEKTTSTFIIQVCVCKEEKYAKDVLADLKGMGYSNVRIVPITEAYRLEFYGFSTHEEAFLFLEKFLEKDKKGKYKKAFVREIKDKI